MLRPSSVAPWVDRFPALTPTLAPATHTNSYALGGRDVLLVEPATPYEDERLEWVAWARGLQSEGRRLVALFATHHHPDHVGGAPFFEEALGLPLWAHARTAQHLKRPVGRAIADGEEIVLDGPEPMRLIALHTPGHASDHLCLHDPERKLLIVGDMVASVGTILIAPPDGDMAEYLRQLARLSALEASVALPAHGDPIQQPSRLLRAYQAHRLMREALALKTVEENPGQTADELLPLVYADTKRELFPIARLSLLAHLAKLEGEGKVRKEREAGGSSATDRYTATP